MDAKAGSKAKAKGKAQAKAPTEGEGEVAPTEGEGEGEGADVAAQDSSSSIALSGTCEYAIAVPVLMNKRAVANGSELLIYRAAPPVKRKSVEPVSLVKIMKSKK